jgi:hypothetical protein
MKRRQQRPVVDRVLNPEEETILDLLDHVLNKGVMATGDLTLGVAGVDLIYVRLSSILCAADRVLPPDPHKATKKTRHKRRQLFG